MSRRRFNAEPTAPATDGPRRVHFDQRTLAVSSDGPRVLTGYAMLWNVPSSPDWMGYTVTLAKDSVRFAANTFALWHHDFSAPLGSTADGSLTITPDDVGVKVTLSLPDTQLGRDVYELVKRGTARGMSFSMLDWKSEFTAPKSELVTSFVSDEVTVTAIPRFPQTSVGTASAKAAAAPRSPAVVNHAAIAAARSRLHLLSIRP